MHPWKSGNVHGFNSDENVVASNDWFELEFN